MVLDDSLLNTQHYKVGIKGKVEQSKERSSALPIPQCSGYQKGSLWITLDYGRQLYLLYFISDLKEEVPLSLSLSLSSSSSLSLSEAGVQ